MAVHARRLPTDSKVPPGVLVEPDAHTDRTDPAEKPTPTPSTNAERSAPPATDAPREARPAKTPVAAPAKRTALPWYRTERWFLVQLASLVPTLVAFAVPRAYRPPFWILGGALLLVGLLMMARNELRRGRSVTDFDPDAS